MKKNIFIGKLCLFNGFGLIIASVLFYYWNTPDFLKGFISGPIFIVLGCFFLIETNKKQSPKIMVSSSTTFISKYFVSTLYVIVFLVFIWFFTFIEVNKEATTFALIFGSVWLSITIWGLRTLLKLSKVEYDKDYLYINENQVIPLADVKQIKGVLPVLYKIITKDKTYYFAPSNSESMARGIYKSGKGTPKSIQKMQNHIKTHKRDILNQQKHN